MYSEEFVTYLYSYNMPVKKEKSKQKKKQYGTKETPLLHVLKSAYATVPMKFNHE